MNWAPKKQNSRRKKYSSSCLPRLSLDGKWLTGYKERTFHLPSLRGYLTMTKFILVLLTICPLQAFAVIHVPLNTLNQENAEVRALVDSEISDFDLDRDRDLLEKSIEIDPLSVLQNQLLNDIAVRNTRAVTPFDQRTLLDPNDWKSQFKLVIWINRSIRGPTAQTLQVWDQGRRVMAVHVSTGKAPTPRDSKAILTPVGYYTPTWLNKDHRSKAFNFAPMPYAIFFNGGVAIHERPANAQWAIGQPASHGCVRMPREGKSRSAETLYKMVQAAGTGEIPEFSIYGNAVMDPTTYKPKTRTGYKTLVIVEQR